MAQRRFQTVRLGIKSLLLHKLRSFLTALGLLFGVSAVISMLAVGEGASYEALEQIKALGPTNLMVRSQKPTDDPGRRASGSRLDQALEYGLKDTDARPHPRDVPPGRGDRRPRPRDAAATCGSGERWTSSGHGGHGARVPRRDA